MRHNRWMLLLGPLVVVLYMAVMGAAGDLPSDDATGAEVVAEWADKDEVAGLAFVMLLAGMAYAAFAAALATALRTDGDDGVFPRIVLAGGAIAAVGFAINANLALVLGDLAEDLDPAAAQALNALFDSFFMVEVIGIGLVVAGTGAALLRSGALPRAFAITGIVLGVVAPLGPAGFATFILGSLWVAIAGVMLHRRPSVAALPT